MLIRKIGHCCLLIKIKDLTILTDPGAFSVDQNEVTGIHLVLITHEHADHLHVESLKNILVNNPQAKVITNSGVGKVLDEHSIRYQLLEGVDTLEIAGVNIEAFDGKHEEIFEEVGQVQNTGYFIDNKLFYPGDSFKDTQKSVDVLALPVAGPWCKISDAIRYALKIKPRAAFPVHDGMLQQARIGGAHAIPKKVLTENGIDFAVIEEGAEKEF